MEEHSREGHVPGASLVLHPISVLQGGVDSQVHDGLSQTILWERAVD